MPSQAKTAFMGFSAARRAEVKEADPSLGFGDIAKRIAELWKAATPEEKAPFEADAAQDKVSTPAHCAHDSSHHTAALCDGKLALTMIRCSFISLLPTDQTVAQRD